MNNDAWQPSPDPFRSTDQWNSNRIVRETVEYLREIAEIRALNGDSDFLKKGVNVYAGLKIKENYPGLRYREFKEIVDRCAEECRKYAGGEHDGRDN